MTTTILPEYTKDVRRNKITRDWDAYTIVDGQEHYLGSRETHLEAETLIDEYITEQVTLASRPVPVVELPPMSKALNNVRKVLEVEPFGYIYINGVDTRRVKLLCLRPTYEDDVILTIDAHEYSALIALLTRLHYQIRPNLAAVGIVAEPAA